MRKVFFAPFFRLPVHPWLLAIYPALAMYAGNVADVHVRELARPIFVAVLGTGVLLLVLRRFCGSWRVAAAVASVLLFAFLLLWGAIARDALERFAETLHVKVRYLAIAYTAFALLIARHVGKLAREHDGVTQVGNVMALLLILMALTQTTANLVKQGFLFSYPTDSNPTTLSAIPSPSTPNAKQFPDLYFVVLDAYARADMLQQYYGIDNTPFLHALSEQGFFVADMSHVSYTDTVLSLPACLNMEYVENLFRDTPMTRAGLETLCRQSRTHQILQQHGYALIGFDSEFRLSKPGPIFDRVLMFPRPWWVPNEFENLLLNQTPFLRVLRYAGIDFAHEMWRRHVLFVLETLHTPSLDYPDQPVFVQAHIVSPHPPFVFRADGSPREPSGVFTLNPRIDPGESQDLYFRYYAEQVLGLNRYVLPMVARILAIPNRRAVIILCSDHGGPRMDRVYPPGALLNFLAVRFPEEGDSSIPHDINLVDLFPVVLNRILGTDLPKAVPPAHLYSEPDTSDEVRAP